MHVGQDSVNGNTLDYFRVSLKDVENPYTLISQIIETAQKSNVFVDVGYNDNGRIAWQGSGGGAEKVVKSRIKELFKANEKFANETIMIFNLYGDGKNPLLGNDNPDFVSALETMYKELYNCSLPDCWNTNHVVLSRILSDFDKWNNTGNRHETYILKQRQETYAKLKLEKDASKRIALVQEIALWDSRLKIIQGYIAIPARKKEIAVLKKELRDSIEQTQAKCKGEKGDKLRNLEEQIVEMRHSLAILTANNAKLATDAKVMGKGIEDSQHSGTKDNARLEAYTGLYLKKEQLPMQSVSQLPYVAESDRYSVYGEYDDTGRVISLITIG